MTVLRVYSKQEWDPAKWDRCVTCGGKGRAWSSMLVGYPEFPGQMVACPDCEGNGSLKAAALAHLTALQYPPMTGGRYDPAEHGLVPYVLPEGRSPLRCQDCSHPMTDGTWEPTRPGDLDERMAEIAAGRMDASFLFDHPKFQHYSACDERCAHGAPIRMGVKGVVTTIDMKTGEVDGPHPLGRQVLVEIEGGTAGNWVSSIAPEYAPVEASWRLVEVQRMSWEHDLRPEHLALLCTRCWAARS